MRDCFEELINKADRGDREAQKEMIQCGDEASRAGEHEKAAFLYKMAAKACRMELERAHEQIVEARRESAWLQGVLQLYRDWVATYTKSVAPRINQLRHFKHESDGPISSLFREGGKFEFIFNYLEQQLMNRRIQIDAGADINRQFHLLVTHSEHFKALMHDTDMRIALDPLSDELLRRVKGFRSC